MRVAFVGKGGAGKSVLAGTLARLLARAGHEVLAVDSDPLPGLAVSVGVAGAEAPLPDDLVVETPEGEEGPRFRLRPDLSADEAVEHYALSGPDGVRLLQFGKLRGPASAVQRSQAAFRQITAELSADRWSVVGDLPGGTRQPAFGWGGYADTFLLVVEPTAKSVLAGRRIMRVLVAKYGQQGHRVLAVVNKAAGEADGRDVGDRLGLDVVATVPADPAVMDAERAGRPLLDHAPDGPAVQAVAALAERLGRPVPASEEQPGAVERA